MERRRKRKRKRKRKRIDAPAHQTISSKATIPLSFIAQLNPSPKPKPLVQTPRPVRSSKPVLCHVLSPRPSIDLICNYLTYLTYLSSLDISI
jgi:hypothetical protein